MNFRAELRGGILQLLRIVADNYPAFKRTVDELKTRIKFRVDRIDQASRVQEVK